ncbi:hypothetical protein N9B73_13680 [Verrucomicrobiales bacterium]|nr:hypothetical protein [Verrucomicrobiales bacterium]
MSENNSGKKETWNHTTPVTFSPLFDWPLNPKGIIASIFKRWVTITRNVLFLGMAILVYRYLLHESSRSQTLYAKHEGVCGLGFL